MVLLAALRGARSLVVTPRGAARALAARRAAPPTIELRDAATRDRIVVSDDAGAPRKWYACGPTVYDATHLGHARTGVVDGRWRTDSPRVGSRPQTRRRRGRT